jgi:hypothetical protein
VKRQLALTLGLIITGTLILFSSCKKINEATELGGDLIPAVDNITTFDTTLTVEAYNDLFTFTGTNSLLDDSTSSFYSDEQFLGVISNDPLFGKTEAEMYFELKPSIYKHSFGNVPDSLHLDSIVLILDYVETYGDSTIPQTINVYEISSEFRADTSYLVRRNDYFTTSNLLGSRTFKPENLKDSVAAYLDTTSNQLRIKLDNSFGERLLNYDTTSGTSSDAYSSDSAFRTKFRGFALKSEAGGNAIMGFNLLGANTKLAIYYKDDNNDAPVDKWDTAVAYFVFKIPVVPKDKDASASANYIQRDYSGTPLLAAQGGTSPDPFVYIQNTPGSFATLKIPGLGSLNNRIVHRAELIAEQVYDVSDSMFPPPAYLFLDAYEPSLSKYLTIPYDLIYDGNSGTYNLGSFGIAPINVPDGSGNVIRTWHFNLSRYVQHVVNNTDSAYELRLFAPFYTKDQYRPPVMGATASSVIININPTLAKGRVRLAGNTDPLDPNPHKMRLRVIYSKL